jgi:hypothetical protein
MWSFHSFVPPRAGNSAKLGIALVARTTGKLIVTERGIGYRLRLP